MARKSFRPPARINIGLAPAIKPPTLPGMTVKAPPPIRAPITGIPRPPRI